MNFLRLFPVIFSFLALSAHFYRAGWLFLAIIALLTIPLLLLKRRWVARFAQLFLLLGALEWLRTTAALVAERNALGMAWTRMALILGGIALFTGASASVFVYSRAVKERYGLR